MSLAHPVPIIDHVKLQNVGSNTHPQIDTHIADTTIHFTDNLTESVKTGSYTIVASDLGKMISGNIAGSTATFTLDAAATLGAGWYVHIKNIGAGQIVIAVTGSETIDVASTRLIMRGSAASRTTGKWTKIWCDGTNFSSLGIQQNFFLEDDSNQPGPWIDLQRVSTSPAALDVLGGIRYSGRDSAGTYESYAELWAHIGDTTAGAESGNWTVQLRSAFGIRNVEHSFNQHGLRLQSLETGAARGCRFRLQNDIINSVNDTVGSMTYEGRSDADTRRIYAKVETIVLDATDGSEDARYDTSVMINGALTSVMEVGADGIKLGDGNDADQSLITVDVTGTPIMRWDESANVFKYTHNLRVENTGDARITLADGSVTAFMRADTSFAQFGTTSTEPIFIAVAGATKLAVFNSGQVGIGGGTGTPDASVLLELVSTTKGFLPPVMTTTQRDAISSPVTGVQVHNATTGQLEYYDSGWSAVGGGDLLADGTIPLTADWDIGDNSILAIASLAVGTDTAEVDKLITLESDQNVATILYTVYGDSVGHTGTIQARKARGTKASPTATQANDILFNFAGQGYEGDTPGFTGTTAVFRVQAAENYTSTTKGTKISFHTVINGGTTRTEKLAITGEGYVAISPNTSALTPLGQLHVDQSSSSGAIPVLYLDQADISEEMIEFNTTIGIGNAIEAVGAKALTITHFIKVTVPGGLTRYFPIGTIA